ncbi:MAG: HI1506-related protein [Alphaproteobacteria bacterium]
MTTVIRIVARPKAGFRRAGVHHPAHAVDHAPGHFTKEELAALKADPNLVVTEVEVGEKAPDRDPKPGGEKKPAK